jgi:hypothetical protein
MTIDALVQAATAKANDLNAQIDAKTAELNALTAQRDSFSKAADDLSQLDGPTKLALDSLETETSNV